MRFPQIEFYKDWRTWAAALYQTLNQTPRSMPLSMISVTTAQLNATTSDGVMANRDGLVVWNTDLTLHCYSNGGHWYQLYDNTLVV